MKEVEDVIGSPTEMLDAIFAACLEKGIKLEDKTIDHVCYRCETISEYHSILTELKSFGTLLHEGMIGGRPIATLKLETPLLYRSALLDAVFPIECIEVPCPKPGRFYPRGLEHAEVVIGAPDADPHHNERELRHFADCHPLVSWDMRAVDKLLNADVAFAVGDRFSVKFHLCPLARVVALEQAAGEFTPVPNDFFA